MNNKYKQKFLLLLENPQFKQEVSILEELVNKKTAIQNPKLFKEVDRLMEKYSFPTIFRRSFINYIFFGVDSMPDTNSKVILETGFKGRIPELRIRIFGDTTLKDIEKVWSDIKKIQKGKGLAIIPIPLPERKNVHFLDKKRFSDTKTIIKNIHSRGSKSFQIAEKIWGENVNLDKDLDKQLLARLNSRKYRLRRKLASKH